jgi:uncharacterized Tic20 family protein
MAEPSEGESRNWAALCHLSALLMFVALPAGLVLGGNILGPLLVWLFKGRDYALVDEHGKESLNFQIVMTIVGILVLLVPVAVVRMPLQVGWSVLDLAFVFVASVRASNGAPYRYPVPVRFIR